MRKVRLNNPLQVVTLGGTIGFEITSDDLKSYTTNNQDATLTLVSAPAGSLIRRVRLVLVKPFAAPTGGTTLAVSVGVNGTAANLLGATTIINAGSPVAAPRMFEAANIVPSFADSTVTLTFDISDANGSLSQATGGVLRVYVDQVTFEAEKDSNF